MEVDAETEDRNLNDSIRSILTLYPAAKGNLSWHSSVKPGGKIAWTVTVPGYHLHNDDTSDSDDETPVTCSATDETPAKALARLLKLPQRAGATCESRCPKYKYRR